MNTGRSTDDTTAAERLEEYKTLRQEIIALASQASSIVQFALAFGAACIVVVFQKGCDNPMLWMCPLVVMVPLFWKTHLLYVEIYMIGRYIEVFLEQKSIGLKWETRWAALNRGDKGKWVNWAVTRLGQHGTIIWSLQLLTVLLGFFNCTSRMTHWRLWVIAGGLLVWQGIALIYGLSPKRLRTLRNDWLDLDKNLCSTEPEVALRHPDTNAEAHPGNSGR